MLYSYQIGEPYSSKVVSFPVDCVLEPLTIENTPSTSTVSIVSGSPDYTINHLQVGTTVENYTIVSYYSNYIGDYDTESKLEIDVSVTIKHCTENAINLLQPITPFFFVYNDSPGDTFDFSGFFDNGIASGIDYAHDVLCPLNYELEMIASLPTYDAPPTFIAINDSTLPIIDITPTDTDRDLVTTIFRINAYY